MCGLLNVVAIFIILCICTIPPCQNSVRFSEESVLTIYIMGYALYELRYDRSGMKQTTKIGYVSVGKAVFYDSSRYTVESFLEIEQKIVDDRGCEISLKHLSNMMHLTKVVGY